MIEMKHLSGGTLTSQDEILCARLSQNFLQRCACESAGMVFVHDLDSSKMSAHQSLYHLERRALSLLLQRGFEKSLTGSLDRGCNSSMISASGVDGVKIGAPAGVSATTCTTCPLASRYFWRRLCMAFREESTSSTCNRPCTYLRSRARDIR